MSTENTAVKLQEAAAPKAIAATLAERAARAEADLGIPVEKREAYAALVADAFGRPGRPTTLKAIEARALAKVKRMRAQAELHGETLPAIVTGPDGQPFDPLFPEVLRQASREAAVKDGQKSAVHFGAREALARAIADGDVSER